MTALTMRDPQLAYDNQSPPEDDTREEWLDSLADAMTDRDITHLLAVAGVDDSILEAAVCAVRTQDFGYLVRTYERLAGPVIRQAAQDEAESLAEREPVNG